MASADVESPTVGRETEQNSDGTEVASQLPNLGRPMNTRELRLLRDDCAASDRRSAQQAGSEDPTASLLERLMAPWDGSEETCWGRVTTGSTEGTLKGVSVGFDRLRARGFNRVAVVYSRTAHDCVAQAALAVAPNSQKVLVPTDHNGAMSMTNLDRLLRRARLARAEAVLMVCTLGTPFFGGCDDVAQVQSLLAKHGFAPGKASYLHIDAALHGGFWNDSARTAKYKIGLDFDSIAISGHKWYGGFTGGALLVTKEGEISPLGERRTEVDGMADESASGSRDRSCAEAWLARLKQFDWRAELERCYDDAASLGDHLRAAGIACAAQHINVLVQRPSEELAGRWQLACAGDEAQVLCMPHLAREDLSRFAREMKAEMLAGKLQAPSVRLAALSGLPLAAEDQSP